jgi:hypothetical protein
MKFARTYSPRAWMVRVATILTLLVAVGLIPAERGAAGHKSCSNNAVTRVEQPVVNGGVHVRGHVKCTQSLDRLDFQVFLFYCGGTKPKQNESYVSGNCTEKANNFFSITNSTPDHDYAGWAPAIGTAGPTASGWYIGCEVVVTTDTHNGSPVSTQFWRTGSPLLKG